VCAIFGAGFLRKHTIRDSNMVRELIRNLFIQNMARGRTASGLAYTSYGSIKVIKKNLNARSFISLPEYDKAESENITFDTAKEQPISILGHCRLKTKGSELNNDNNHPIVLENVVGVHNGCISNDDHLFTIYSKIFKRKAEVDSEIIFALINHFAKETSIHEAIRSMSSLIQGSFACAMVHRLQPHVIWLFRRTNPCDVFLYEDQGLLLWSSEERFISDAMSFIRADFGIPKKIAFPADTGLGIDLWRNLIHRFDIQGHKHYALY